MRWNLNNLSLDLGSNNLTGSIPENICNINGWTHLEGNQLCPPYPSCFSPTDVGIQDLTNCDEIIIQCEDGYVENDNFDLENSHVIPAIMRKIHEAKQQGSDSVEIWGTGKEILTECNWQKDSMLLFAMMMWKWKITGCQKWLKLWKKIIL